MPFEPHPLKVAKAAKRMGLDLAMLSAKQLSAISQRQVVSSQVATAKKLRPRRLSVATPTLRVFRLGGKEKPDGWRRRPRMCSTWCHAGLNARRSGEASARATFGGLCAPVVLAAELRMQN
jgi:hypothetical protein